MARAQTIARAPAARTGIHRDALGMAATLGLLLVPRS